MRIASVAQFNFDIDDGFFRSTFVLGRTVYWSMKTCFAEQGKLHFNSRSNGASKSG